MARRTSSRPISALIAPCAANRFAASGALRDWRHAEGTGPQGRRAEPKARHDYHIEDTWEAGLVLMGTEVKSLRQGRAIAGRRVRRGRRPEVWLHGVHIPEYTQGTWTNHAARRTRKLLLQPRRDRQDRAQDRRQGLHAGPALAVLQGRPGQGRDRAGQGQEGLRQAARPRRAPGRPREGAGRRTPAQGSARLMPVEIVGVRIPTLSARCWPRSPSGSASPRPTAATRTMLRRCRRTSRSTVTRRSGSPSSPSTSRCRGAAPDRGPP